MYSKYFINFRSRFGSRTGGPRNADLWKSKTILQWRTNLIVLLGPLEPFHHQWWVITSPRPPWGCPLDPTVFLSITSIRFPTTASQCLQSWSLSDEHDLAEAKLASSLELYSWFLFRHYNSPSYYYYSVSCPSSYVSFMNTLSTLRCWQILVKLNWKCKR